jgi:methane monooxygenase component A gamma chain
MTRETRAAAGATPRTDYPPFGNQTSRKEWTERLADVTTLRTALDLLIDWRREHDPDALEEADVLWIEARLRASRSRRPATPPLPMRKPPSTSRRSKRP